VNKFHIASFTNLGFRLHSREFQPIEVDLSGKTAVVTGATGGLGLETARSLAALGSRVVIVGRNSAKLDAARQLIDGDITTRRADLGLLGEVRTLATGLLESEPQIDILVNNVGVLLPERQVTSEGIEKTLATNLAGHFLLTNMLLPRLIGSAPSRVINVASGGLYSQRIRPDDLESENGDYSGAAAYARTKRGQVILTEMWAARYAGTGVTFHSMHPGWARTAGVAESLPTFNRIMNPFLRTAAQGVDTIVWLAVSPDAGRNSGKFWFDRQEAPTHLTDSTRETESDRFALWARLDQITNPVEVTT
jgi:NAD(P)-dependent dehydrogenase (short-subunit alcohol dehydrogenase family)